jgi:aspergillopepsin I
MVMLSISRLSISVGKLSTSTSTPDLLICEYIGVLSWEECADTGPHRWVFSSELPSSQQSGHEIYNPEKSSSSKLLRGASWDISYGDGSSASGKVYTDTVNVGGTIVTGQAVETASQISSQFVQDPNNDGLLGLAFSSINTVSPQPQKTFFDNAIAQGVLSSNVFTVDLKKGEPGTYDFGYIDDAKKTSDVHYTSIDTSNGFWEFTSTGYAVGGNDSFQQQNIQAIADTGTTLLMIEESIVDAYYAQVNGAKYNARQGGYVFPCSANLPDFYVGIGDYQARVPGAYINLVAIDNAGSSCFGGIQSSQGIPQSIFGDVFLKAVFAVFDGENTQFGVAEKSLSGTVVSGGSKE